MSVVTLEYEDPAFQRTDSLPDMNLHKATIEIGERQHVHCIGRKAGKD